MPTSANDTSTSYKKGKLYSIPLSELTADPDQPRKTFDGSELKELMLSIQTHGQLSPILFRADGGKGLVLVSGERRFRACQALGLSSIQGIFIDTNKHDEVALVDNLQREDLHPVDLAEAISSLKDKHGYTQEQLGAVVGKAQNTVSEILALMALSEEIRNDARHRKELSRGALLKVARIKRATSQRKAYDALVASLGMPKKEIKRPRLSVTKKAITSTDNTLKCLKGIDLDTLGDDRAAVVSKLQELLQEIQNKLVTMRG